MDASSVCVLCLVQLLTLSECSGRAQFNLFPNNWNNGNDNMLDPPAEEANQPPSGSRCFTLLDIQTHGSPDCPRDFNHQIFDTHTCRFVCLPKDNQRPSLYDQNGIAGGDKPRSGLP